MAIKARSPKAPPHAELEILGTTPATVPIYSEQTLLGTAPEANLILDDSSAGRRHASIQRRGDKFYLRNIRPKNGTFVNGERVTDERRLVDGDAIQLANMQMRFRELPNRPRVTLKKANGREDPTVQGTASISPIPTDLLRTLVGGDRPGRKPLPGIRFAGKVQNAILRVATFWNGLPFNIAASAVIFTLLTRKLRILTSGLREFTAVGLVIALSFLISFLLFKLLNSERLARLVYGRWEFGKLPFLRTLDFDLMLALDEQFDVKFSTADVELMDETRRLHGDVTRELAAAQFLDAAKNADVSVTVAQSVWDDVWKSRILERRRRGRSYGQTLSGSYVWNLMPSVLISARALMAPLATVSGLILLFFITYRSRGNFLPELQVMLFSGIVTAALVAFLAYNALYDIVFYGYKILPDDALSKDLKSKIDKCEQSWGRRTIHPEEVTFGPHYLSLVRSYLLRPLALGLGSAAILQLATLAFAGAATLVFAHVRLNTLLSMYGHTALLLLLFPFAFLVSMYLGITVISGIRRAVSGVLSGLILIAIPPLLNLFITGHLPKSKETLAATVVAAAITGIASLLAELMRVRIEGSPGSVHSAER